MKNNNINETNGEAGPDNFVRFWHLAMVALCLAAWLTGDLADDYKKVEYTGFLIHGWIGMAVTVTVCIYLGYGLAGPKQSSFSQWSPFTGEQLRQTWADLAGPVRFRLSEHKSRHGLAGLVQFFGILTFVWLAATGLWMYLFVEPGIKMKGALHAIKEAHEIGEVVIPLYLCVHIGAVIVHSLNGNHVWKEIFFMQKKMVPPKNHKKSRR